MMQRAPRFDSSDSEEDCGPARQSLHRHAGHLPSSGQQPFSGSGFTALTASFWPQSSPALWPENVWPSAARAPVAAAGTRDAADALTATPLRPPPIDAMVGDMESPGSIAPTSSFRAGEEGVLGAGEAAACGADEEAGSEQHIESSRGWEVESLDELDEGEDAHPGLPGGNVGGGMVHIGGIEVVNLIDDEEDVEVPQGLESQGRAPDARAPERRASGTACCPSAPACVGEVGTSSASAGVSRPASPAGCGPVEPGWSCDVCTFDNIGAHLQCAACGGQRTFAHGWYCLNVHCRSHNLSYSKKCAVCNGTNTASKRKRAKKAHEPQEEDVCEEVQVPFSRTEAAGSSRGGDAASGIGGGATGGSERASGGGAGAVGESGPSAQDRLQTQQALVQFMEGVIDISAGEPRHSQARAQVRGSDTHSQRHAQPPPSLASGRQANKQRPAHPFALRFNTHWARQLPVALFDAAEDVLSSWRPEEEEGIKGGAGGSGGRLDSATRAALDWCREALTKDPPADSEPPCVAWRVAFAWLVTDVS